MSSSAQTLSSIFSLPVALFQYPLTGVEPPPLPDLDDEAGASADLVEESPAVILTEEALAGRLALARAEATHQAETRLRQDYEARLGAEAGRVATAIREFEESKQAYFSRVEVEIVRLALSIAGKILHREAQVDPMLVAALVQIAISQLKDGSTVSLRVRPEQTARWRDHFAAAAQNLKVNVISEASLTPGGCILETELGSADFSLDSQLKEVEQGFFDVLAQRP